MNNTNLLYFVTVGRGVLHWSNSFKTKDQNLSAGPCQRTLDFFLPMCMSIISIKHLEISKVQVGVFEAAGLWSIIPTYHLPDKFKSLFHDLVVYHDRQTAWDRWSNFFGIFWGLRLPCFVESFEADWGQWRNTEIVNKIPKIGSVWETNRLICLDGKFQIDFQLETVN